MSRRAFGWYSNRAFALIVASLTVVVFEGLFVPGLHAQSVVLMSRGEVREQLDAGLVSLTDTDFRAIANPPTGVSLLAISAADHTNWFSDGGWPGLLEASDAYTSPDEFTINHPAGTAHLVALGSSSTTRIAVPLTDAALPVPLLVTNWDAASYIVMGQTYTLAWVPMAGASATDSVVVRLQQFGQTVFISPLPGRPGSLKVGSGSVVIPPATFTNTEPCDVELTTVHLTSTNTTSLPGTTVLAGRHSTTTFRLRVVDGATPPPTILTTNLPAFPVGEPGFAGLEALGGIRPLRFEVASGSLPAGLGLDPMGAVSGTATAVGTSSATVRVTDLLGRTSVQAISVTTVAADSASVAPLLSHPYWLAGKVGFDISGTATTTYTIERSIDLVHWTTAMTTNAPGAQFSLVLPSTNTVAFFRVKGPDGGGYPAPPVAPIGVTPVLDSATSSSGDLDPAGGTLGLTNSAGYVFTLTIPEGALAGPETITLTAVNSIGGLPLSGGLRAAVSLEPEGLAFFQPVRLDITSPTGFAANSTIGFGANQDGQEFALKLSFVTNNTATLYFWHFTMGGVGAGTSGDAQGQAANGPDNPGDSYQQQAAAALAECRADPNCDINDDKKLDELAEIAIGEFDNVVKPLLKQAVSDDTLLSPAIQGFLQWWRNVELLALDRAGKVNDVRQGRIQSRLAIGNSLASAALHNALTKACQGCLNHDITKIEKMLEIARAAALLNYGDYLPEIQACIAKCLRFELHFRSTFDLPTDLGTWTVKTEARVKLRLAENGVDIQMIHKYAYLSGSGSWDITDINPPSFPPPIVTIIAPKSGRMTIPAFMLKLYKQRTVWVPGTGAVTNWVLQPNATMFLKATKPTPSENAELFVVTFIQQLPDLFAPSFAAMHIHELVQQPGIAPPEWFPSFVMGGWAGQAGGDIILTRSYVQTLSEAVENTLIELHHTPAE